MTNTPANPTPTIHMDSLVRTVDAERPIIEWWTHNHRNKKGKALHKIAKDDFKQFSIRNGGGMTPTITTRQTQTAKTDLNDSVEWEEIIRYLMAANRSGLVNLCPHSTPECRAGCLGHTSGRLRYTVQQKAQYIRTAYLIHNPAFFHIVELGEVAAHARRIAKKGMRTAARLNGTSDVPYERLPWYMDCLERVGLGCMFDYTADHNRERGWIGNTGSTLPYHLTHSTKEGTHPNNVHPGSYTVVAIKKGDPMPAEYNGYPVFDGDSTDLRFLDPEGHVTLGRAKGALKKEKGAVNSFVKPPTHKRNAVSVSIVPRTSKKVTA